jgi:glycosyltransferase involved in cell wall biosynthesis
VAVTRKVLHIIDTPNLSGPGKTIVNSCLFTDRTLYEKQVAAFSHIGQNQFIEHARKRGIPASEIQERFWWLPGPLSNLAVWSQLRSLVKRESIDLIHTHGYKSDVLGYLAGHGSKAKLVTTQHGFIRNTLLGRLYNRLAIMAAMHMDRVIAVSHNMRDTLRDAGVPEHKLVVIHNAIVVSSYPPSLPSEAVLERHSIRACSPIISCIGRLSPEKGQDILCQAIISLSHEFPSICLMLIGTGPDLEVLKERYGKHSRHIVFVGHASDVREYLSVTDIHVLPSFTEGLPNVVLEAGCMGIPTVATSVGGTPECLIDGVTGILVPPGSASILAETISRLHRGKAMRQKLGAEASCFVRKKFSFENRVNNIMALYEELFAFHPD